MSTKKVTTNELAERIDGVQVTMTQLGQKIDTVNLSLTERIDQVNDSLGKRIDGVQTGLGSLEGRFVSLEGRFVSLEGRFVSLEGRFDSLEGRFDEMMDFLQENVATKADLKTLIEESNRKFNLQRLDMIDLMDDKDHESKNHFTMAIKKEDEKLGLLIDVLTKKKVLTKKEAGAIRTFRPLAR